MGKETIFMEEDIREYARQYRERYQPYKQYWNYEDGVVLTGYEALYRADGDSACRDFVIRYLEKVISPEGEITNYPMDK